MTVADSAAAIPVQRAAKLFGLRLLLLTVAPDDLPLSSWLESVLRRPVLPTSEIIELMLSPPCQRGGEIGDVSIAPARDQAAVALSDRLLVASMRPRGTVHRLVLDRLQSSGWPTASVYLAIGPGLVDKKLAEPLMRLGAVGWLVLEGEPSPELGGPRPVSAPAIIDIPSALPWPYLTHCTRRRDGPWPDQTQDDFLDQLILGHPSADHSALAALSSANKRAGITIQ
jgi:hypothetical protein